MKKYFIILVLFFINLLSAQVKFEARVSRTSIGVNENIRIEFSMNADGDNFDPPNFESCGFRVVGGPSQSISQSWINGRSSFQKSYSYIIMPLRKGNLIIKNATIEINNQVFKTNVVPITVGNAVVQQPRQDPYANNPYYNPPAPTPPQQVPNAGKSGVELVAEISNTNPYINEPITVVYKILVSSRSAVSGFKEVNKPKYADFWSQDIEVKNPQVQTTKYKGEDYRFLILKKVVLYPQKAGTLQIEPLSLDVQVEVPVGRPDIFGNFETATQDKRVAAGAKSITVRALPEAGKPDDFTGAVGQFNFAVTPSKNTVKNGESLDLTVAVSGNGNLKLFSLPKPIVPSSLEMYDPEHTENVTTPITGMTGSISDKYTITADEKGNFPIKGLRFSYFDLATKSYKTVTSKDILINVLDGPGVPKSNSKINSPTQEASKTFAFIKQKTNLEAINSDDFLGSTSFYLLLLTPFFMIPIIVLFKKKKEAQDADVVGNRMKKSNALAKKYLTEAKKHINNKEPFYIALEKAMHNFLKAKLNIETSEMSKDKINEILLSKNANQETVKNFIALTESCELARYAPSSSTLIHQDYEKAVEIISNLEKQIS